MSLHTALVGLQAEELIFSEVLTLTQSSGGFRVILFGGLIGGDEKRHGLAGC